ncbi:hypothetical protein [Pseudoxanthomonas mexicana]|uniref:hypothetical protein n=1 Tax=Pseudoxanthomonas mexicana TaxID=128785 RepID=UPI0028AB247A|nr:hypothetical protein [Pseudoxanthomonas mexicana]
MINRALDRPAKRLGLLVLLAGVAVLCVGAGDLGRFTSVADCLIDWDARRGCSAVRWGAGLIGFAVVGLFGFGLLVQPLLRWIRYGSAKANR